MSDSFYSPNPYQSQSYDAPSTPVVPQQRQPAQDYQVPQVSQVPQYQPQYQYQSPYQPQYPQPYPYQPLVYQQYPYQAVIPVQTMPVMPVQTLGYGGVVVTQSNGMGTASLVLGLISVLFAVVPFVGIFVAAPCSLLAFIFGIVGMVKGSQIHIGFGMALAGLLLSLLSGIMFPLGGGLLW